MTWNIHGGIGSDGEFNLDRIVALIRQHAPDILALQEVDSRGAQARRAVFEELSEALGPNSAEARVITAADGDYGHILLSRWPLTEIRLHDISIGRRERRAAIETTVISPQGYLHVVAAHLGLSFRERRHQAAVLRSLAEAGPAHSVVMGDFNDWFLRGSVQKALAASMPARTHLKTFPAWSPRLALDRIYCRPAGMLAENWTDPQARWLSDHLPLVARLSIPNDSQTIASGAHSP